MGRDGLQIHWLDLTDWSGIFFWTDLVQKAGGK